MERIENMFTKRPVNPSFKEGIIVTLFFVALVTCMSFLLNNEPPGSFQEGEKVAHTVNSELPDGKHLFAKTDEEGDIEKLYVEGKKIPKRKYDDYRLVIDSLISLESSNQPAHPVNGQHATATKTKDEAEAKAIEAEIQEALDKINQDLTDEEKAELSHAARQNNGLVSGIMEEINTSLSEELKREFGEDFQMSIDAVEDGEKVVMRIDGNKFIMDINNEKEKVMMHMDEKGFVMDVNEDGEQVKMRFDSTGFSINVTENGKETVNIEFGPNGAVFDVED